MYIIVYILQCSKLCGGGEQWRRVVCMHRDDLAEVNDLFCEGSSSKPERRQTCNTQTCLEWDTSQWSQVPTLCPFKI